MIGTDRLLRARVRALERVGNDLCVRCQAWLWNLTGAFSAKEPEPLPVAADKAYRYVEELLDILELAIGDAEFLAGDHPTIADCTAFAIFQTAWERFDQPFARHHQRLDAWYANFRARPSADF